MNPIREPISQWGQWDSNPRPPAPQAYTPIEMVSLTKLDDSPSNRNFIIPLLNVHNSDQYLNRDNSHLELHLFVSNIIASELEFVVPAGRSIKDAKNYLVNFHFQFVTLKI